jgi:hypothetical protein
MARLGARLCQDTRDRYGRVVTPAPIHLPRDPRTYPQPHEVRTSWIDQWRKWAREGRGLGPIYRP